jgi:DNA-binding NarL/FixJ family response regulator
MAADEEQIRVLVVDDHAVVRRGLLAFLAGESDLDVVGEAREEPRRSTSSHNWTPTGSAPTSC